LKPGTDEDMDRLEQQFALYHTDRALPNTVLSADIVDVACNWTAEKLPGPAQV